MTRPLSIDTLLAVVGLPRSGTTLLTALLDAHPHIALYYEPWNAFRRDPPPVPASLEEFRALMERRFSITVPPETRILGFKETTIQPAATEWATHTLERLSATCPTRVVWIHRDLVQCLLSKVEAARRWWGHADARFSRESLVTYLRDTASSLSALERLVRSHAGLVVQYDALVERPAEVLSELMAWLGEEFRPAQLAYHEAGPQPQKVMGDPEVARHPAPVSPGRRAHREAELRRHAGLVDEVLAREEFSWIRRERERLLALPPLGDPSGAPGDQRRP